MKRWLKVAIVLVLVCIASGVVLFDVILEGILKTKLQSIIQQQEDRIYDYSFDGIKVKFITGDLILEHLEIAPRNHILDSLAREGQGKHDVFHIKLDEFKIQGLQSWRLVLYNEINIETILFDQPQVIHYVNQQVESVTSHELAGDIIAPTLTSALIGNLALSNADFHVYFVNEDTALAASFDSASLRFEALQSNSALLANGEYIRYDKVEVDIHHINITSMKDYRFELDRIYNNFDERVVHFEGIRLSPRKDKFEFMKSQEYEVEWFKVEVSELLMKALDVKKIQESGMIRIQGLTMAGVNLELYKDKRLPDPPFKVKDLPSKKIREFEKQIHIEEINVTDFGVHFYEWNQEGIEPFSVKLDKGKIRIENFSTNQEVLAINDTLKIDAGARFMNSGNLEVSIRFPVLDSSNKLFMDGRLTDVLFSDLNPILENSAFVKFDQGRLNYVDFNLTADETQSYGVLNMDYEGLKGIHVVRNQHEMQEKKEKGKENKKEKKLVSALANTLVANSYNPDSKNYYPGEIHFQREKNKGIFGYLVKSIISVILTSIVPSKQSHFHEKKKEKKKQMHEKSKQEKMSNKQNRKK